MCVGLLIPVCPSPLSLPLSLPRLSLLLSHHPLPDSTIPAVCPLLYTCSLSSISCVNDLSSLETQKLTSSSEYSGIVRDDTCTLAILSLLSPSLPPSLPTSFLPSLPPSLPFPPSQDTRHPRRPLVARGHTATRLQKHFPKMAATETTNSSESVRSPRHRSIRGMCLTQQHVSVYIVTHSDVMITLL